MAKKGKKAMKIGVKNDFERILKIYLLLNKKERLLCREIVKKVIVALLGLTNIWTAFTPHSHRSNAGESKPRWLYALLTEKMLYLRGAKPGAASV